MRRSLTLLALGFIITVLTLPRSSATRCDWKVEFRCGDGECISKGLICDGTHHCKDHSDETTGCQKLEDCPSDTFTCDNNGTCIQQDWVCDGNRDCHDGSDEDTALCNERICRESQFKCTKVGHCIPSEWRCDGERDCVDYSDEEDCKQTCSSDQFTCVNDSNCIEKAWVCDGNDDCDDGSDEKDCQAKAVCKNDEFRCENNRCIDSLWRCDGSNDCHDNSDELNCTVQPLPFTCKVDEFECRTKRHCVAHKWICDGDSDCPDGSDEEAALCGSSGLCEGKDTFRCQNGTQCIGSQLKCDGNPDCDDHSDELSCDTAKCTVHLEFNCKSNPPKCISQSAVCDQRMDCSNGADEDPQMCENAVNECETNRSECTHTCHDLPVGYYCDCDAGYELDVTGRKCVDTDECLLPDSCSQTCTNTPGSYHCSCIEGYFLDPSTQRCKAIDHERFLLLANKNNVIKMSLTTSDMTAVMSLGMSITAIDFDYTRDRVFWSDSTTQSIQSCSLSHHNDVARDRVRSVVDVNGLAYDWLHQLLYFTSGRDKSIGVVQTNSPNYGKTLIKDRLAQPRAIAVDPSEGWLYWSDWGEQPRIEKAGMNGLHRRAIVVESVVWPTGLTIDYVHRRLYWVDAKLHLLASCDLDGGNLNRILVDRDSLAHPFAVSVFEDWLYWTDPEKDHVFKVDKLTLKDNSPKVEGIRSQLTAPIDVKAFHPLRQAAHPRRCGSDNGGCSHLCLPAPNTLNASPNFTCDCPDGMLLTDGVTCKAPVICLPLPPPHEEPLSSSLLGEVAKITLGIVVASLVLSAVVVLFVVIARYRRRNTKTMKFNNPAYFKTTEVEPLCVNVNVNADIANHTSEM